MRNFLLLSIIVGASACAARAPQNTLPVQYSCGEASVVRKGDRLFVESSASENPQRPTTLGWHDDDGDHFVSWPLSPTDVEAVDFVMPTDRRADAVQRVYDTSKGVSTADWRLTKRQVCTAKGGYNDVLARYINGTSIDDLASELAMDRNEARGIVHSALTSVQKRYWHDARSQP